jgi:hypothetical protein
VYHCHVTEHPRRAGSQAANDGGRPRRASTTNPRIESVGFAIGTGGLSITLLGWIADHWGLPTALWISAMMPLAGFVAALFLPEPARR